MKTERKVWIDQWHEANLKEKKIKGKMLLTCWLGFYILENMAQKRASLPIIVYIIWNSTDITQIFSV